MGDKQKQSNPSEIEQVARAAELYTHLNDALDAEGQYHAFIHYHLGFSYATEQLANKLEGLGVDSSWHLIFGLTAFKKPAIPAAKPPPPTGTKMISI